MRKFFLIMAAFLLSTILTEAVPAYPYPITVQQPDGSTVMVHLHGDEFSHWFTAADGRTLAIGPDGFVREQRYRSMTAFPSMAADRRRRAQQERAQHRAAPELTVGSKHFLVMLIEFSDLGFSTSDAHDRFYDMLNKKGYSANGGTGSAHDYYYDQSMGVFDPVFDVIGPVKVGGKMADYGGDDSDGRDKDPAGLLAAACSTAVAQNMVDFSEYDLDGDGYIDNIFFYYAGFSEAEGATSDAIWPHASGIYGGTAYNGVKIGSYACSAELRGTSGHKMTGIGVFCHEFGHVLGLPDFYDTDGEENGEGPGLMDFSLMSGGCYNNDLCSPPNLGAIERNMLGWMADPEPWTEEGIKTIPAITSNVAYSTPTNNEGEYFVYEVRDGTGWDAYIRYRSLDPAPRGMLVYHVDKSRNLIGDVTAAQRWTSGYGINEYGDHPCCAIVCAKTPYSSYGQVVFPGTADVREFSGKNGCTLTWDGGFSGYDLYDISYSSGSVSLNLVFDMERNISGYVLDSSGNPLEGVEVAVVDRNALGSVSRHFAPGKPRSLKQVRDAASVASVVTGEDGHYSMDIPSSASSALLLSAAKNRYRLNETEIELAMGSICKDITLLNAVEGDSQGLSKYHAVSGYGIGFGEGPCSITAGVYFTEKELKDYVGYKITDIRFVFYSSGGNADEVSVFVDFDNDRKYTRKVDSPNFANGFSAQSVAEAGLTVPAGKEVIFGYALKNNAYGYPVAIDSEEDKVGYGLIRNDCEARGGGWSGLGYEDESGTHKYVPIVEVYLMQEVSPFVSFGIKIISTKASYTAGNVYDFSFIDASSGGTPVSTAWYYDGQPRESGSIAVTSGEHEVKAVCTYSDGRTEEIVQMIKVQ